MEANPEMFGWIRDYMFRLAYVVRGAPADFFELLRVSPRYAVAQTRRGRPNVICDFFGPRVQEAFGDIPNEVRIDNEYETPELYFWQHGARLKFNQGDEAYRVHQPNTARAYSFVNNAPCLPGWDLPLEDYSLFGVYGLDSTGTNLLRASLTCQHNDRIVWRNELPEPPADSKWAIIKPSSPQIGPAIIDDDEQRAVNE